jgi:hypothetical protein
MAHRRLLAGAVAGLLGFALWQGPALGGAGPSYTVTPNPAQPGDELTLVGESCIDETVLASLYIADDEMAIAGGQTESSVDGSWTLTMTVPADVEPGTYYINATCNDPNQPYTLGTVDVQIGEPDPDPEPEPEPEPAPEPAPSAAPAAVAPTFAG